MTPTTETLKLHYGNWYEEYSPGWGLYKHRVINGNNAREVARKPPEETHKIPVTITLGYECGYVF